jgi:hypothetical protein
MVLICKRARGFNLFALGTLLVVGVMALPSAHAQVLYGSIVGSVRDNSGAVVPGADVTITHNATGLTRSTLSSDQGAYDFPTIPTGNWTLKVTLSGFKEFSQPSVTVTVNTVTRVNVLLEVG